MSLYSIEIPALGEIHRKALVLPRKALWKIHTIKHILYSHKEAPRCVHFSGVLTIEAALILPLLTYFFVSVLFFFRIMQVQIVVQDALNNTGRKLALHQEQNNLLEVAATKSLFWNELEDKDLLEAYVENGIWGVSFIESQFDEEQIHLKANYRICLPMQLFWEVEFDMQQRADCRRWNGWHFSSDNELIDTWVYVAETGDVYHLKENCSHLELSISSVRQDMVSYLRNEKGERYRKCSQCEENDMVGENIYVTNQGNCYHYDLTCSGIKRTVYMIRKSDVGSRSCCSRCGISGAPESE